MAPESLHFLNHFEAIGFAIAAMLDTVPSASSPSIPNGSALSTASDSCCPRWARARLLRWCWYWPRRVHCSARQRPDSWHRVRTHPTTACGESS